MKKAHSTNETSPYPYNLIEEWWGESLSRDLCGRVKSAPKAHRQAFAADIRSAADHLGARLPELQEGVLRPLLRPTSEVEEPFTELLQVGLNVLLYSQEIVMEGPIHSNLKANDVSQVFETLLSLKPLADAGIVHMGRGLLSRSLHPSGLRNDTYTTMNAALPEIEEALGCNESNAAWTAYHVMRLIDLTRNLDGRANPMARDNDEFIAMVALMRNAWTDRKFFDVTTLANLSLPRLQGTLSELVTIRQSDESFALWREALSGALAQLNRITVNDENWQRDANAIIYAELEPIRSKVKRVTAKSPVLNSMSTGASHMLLAGVGAAGGWAVGGNPFSALTASAITTGLGSVAAYLRAAKERAANQAILDLALAFQPD